MGRPEIKIPKAPFLYGGDLEGLCRDCQLPCTLEVTSVDCMRRFFLAGFLQCTYFVSGHCFLINNTGCVFDNQGDHDPFWADLLNNYHHNVNNCSASDQKFANNVERAEVMIQEQIDAGNVSLCRYLEEYYNRIMEEGGGLSQDVMEKLDDAYMSLLAGVGRKP